MANIARQAKVDEKKGGAPAKSIAAANDDNNDDFEAGFDDYEDSGPKKTVSKA